MSKLLALGVGLGAYYLLRNISVFGYEGKRSVVVGYKDHYFLSANIMPFHEYSEHLEAFNQFIEDAYMAYMRSELEDDFFSEE